MSCVTISLLHLTIKCQVAILVNALVLHWRKSEWPEYEMANLGMNLSSFYSQLAQVAQSNSDIQIFVAIRSHINQGCHYAWVDRQVTQCTFTGECFLLEPKQVTTIKLGREWLLKCVCHSWPVCSLIHGVNGLFPNSWLATVWKLCCLIADQMKFDKTR